MSSAVLPAENQAEHMPAPGTARVASVGLTVKSACAIVENAIGMAAGQGNGAALYVPGVLGAWRYLRDEAVGNFHDYAASLPYADRTELERALRAAPPQASSGAATYLRAMPAGDFVRDFVPPVYVLDPIIVRGQVVATTGLPNVGKSAIAVPLALCATGLLRLPGLEADPCRVLYLIGENDANLAVQLIAACEHWSIAPDALNGRLWVVPQRFGLGTMVGEIAALAELVGGFGLVAVDTRVAYSESLDENDNAQAAEDARALRDLSRVEGEPAVIALCHPPKNAQREALYPRGGSAFFGEIDCNLTLWNDGEIVELGSNKRRMPDFDPIRWRLEQVETSRVDRKGRPVRSVVASIVGDSDAQEDASRRQDDNRLLWALLHHPDDSIAEWATHCGWTYKGNPAKSKVSRVLSRLLAADLVRRYGDRWTLTGPGKGLARGVK